MKNKSFLSSVLSLNCPRCRKGHMFRDEKTFTFTDVQSMPERCPVCGQPYFIEVAFYYGALYVSYGVSVALSVANFVWYFLLFDWNTWQYLLINFGILAFLFPYILRVSRSIWAHLFIRFDPDAENNKILPPDIEGKTPNVKKQE
ncbi:MAG: DUF983 domain-containing protein [Chitinophagaceae bacterium]|nr:MAG: DUF983 domain-containing protein [Chitinophagaceae bacterium]